MPVDLPPRLRLARTPTPIEPLARLAASLELPQSLWVWRDDLTGCELGGNKVRKLEFLLAEAQAQGATALVTCGGLQSNHVRATVFAGRRLGMKVRVVLRMPPEGSEPEPALTANYLLDRLGGAEVTTLSLEDYARAGRVYDRFLSTAANVLERDGHVPYVIPEGGSNTLGTLGYVAAVEEMLATWRADGPGTAAPDAIFVALGSGGTHAGLALGCAANDLDPSIVHAVNVCNDAAYFQDRVGGLIARTATRFGLPRVTAPLQIHDGHVGAGYGQASDDDLRFYASFAAQEGMVLDPCYTGKAMRGMLRELARDPERFGEHVLFLHSGGVFEAFAYAAQYERALRG